MRTIRIAVIGGGLAGLTVAHLLKKHSDAFGDGTKIHVAVFEAAQALSGEKFPLPIADTERETLFLLKALNVELVPQCHSSLAAPYSELMVAIISEILMLKSNNIIEKPADWSTKDHAILDKLDSISIIEFFVKKGNNADTVRSLLASSFIGSYADNLDNLSALDALRFVSQYLHCKFLYTVKEGDDHLLHALVDSLNVDEPCVFFNKPIQEVKRIEGQWQVRFVDSDSQSFDHVVMAESPKKATYSKPGQRRLVPKFRKSNDVLFFVGAYTSMDAPASTNGAVKSAHHVVNQYLLPAIYATLPNKDDALTPAVPMAVFTSGNDAILDGSTPEKKH